jgi:AraC family transcriptional regulator
VIEPALPRIIIDAELHVPVASVQVARFLIEQPHESLFRHNDGYRLDLSLTPRSRNTKVSFERHWGPHRFERLGKVFMVPPGEVMRTRADSGNMTSVLCTLREQTLQDWFEQKFECSNRTLEASLDISSETIQRLIIRLGEEARNPGFASKALSEAMAVQVAIELSRYYEDAAANSGTGGLQPWRLKRIDERLREQREQPTLEELAKLCGLSVRQLTRGFRISRGCSVGEYIAQSRVENAKRLLAGGESVKSIAFSMGFSSPSSFCHAFRKATGNSPNQFRQQVGYSYNH